jgi:hypothetical protein
MLCFLVHVVRELALHGGRLPLDASLFLLFAVGLFGTPFVSVGVQSLRGRVTARGILENSIGSIGLGLATVGLGAFLLVSGQALAASIAAVAGVGLVTAGALALVARSASMRGAGASRSAQEPFGASADANVSVDVSAARFECPHCEAPVAALVRGTDAQGKPRLVSPPAYRRCQACHRRFCTRDGTLAALTRGVSFAFFAWLVVFARLMFRVAQGRTKFSEVFPALTIQDALLFAALTGFFWVMPFLKYWFLDGRLAQSGPGRTEP